VIPQAVLAPELRIFAGVVLLLFMGWVVRLIRSGRLSLRDSLLWFVSTLAALAVTAFPASLAWTARALGVEVPSNALFALAFVYVLANLLSVTIAVSGNASRVRRLTQECALLRAEIDGLRARVEGR
jgi:hypothetical protein